MSDAELEQKMRQTLRIARQDRMMQGLEQLWRGNEDRYEGALCMAIVIGQVVMIDQDTLVKVILEDWNGDADAGGV